MDTTKKRKNSNSYLKRITAMLIAVVGHTMATKFPKSKKINYKILKNSTIEAGESMTLITNGRQENEEEMLYIVLPDNFKRQKYEVSLTNLNSREVINSFNCSGFSDIICPVNIPYSPNSDFSLEIKNHNEITAENLVVLFGEYYPGLVEDDAKFNTAGVSGMFKIAVSFENLGDYLSSGFDRSDYRIKFALEKKVVTHGMDGEQMLRMNIKGEDIQETDQLIAEDLLSLNSELVKIHSNSDSCPSKDCVYYVKVFFQSIRYLNFRTSITKYERHIPLSDSIMITDEVTPSRNLVFNFEKQGMSNWEFILIPLVGNPDMYINSTADNPNNQASLDQYAWVTKQTQNQERVIITEKECGEKKIGCQKFSVVIHAPEDRSTFSLIVKTSDSKNPQYFLDLNVPFTGTVEKGEIIQFLVDLDPEMPEVMRASVELTKVTGAGNPDLYLKDCEKEEECLITQEDILNKDKYLVDGSKFFRYSDEEGNYDKIYLEINIEPKSINSGYIFDNSHYLSKNNKIAVAVRGNDKESAFRLSFNAKSPHVRLQEESQKKISVIQGQKKYFVFSTFRPLDEISAALFTFSLEKGKAVAYMSRSNKYPSENNHEQKLELVNYDAFDYWTLPFIPYFNVTKDERENTDISGDYYFTVEASDTSFLTIGTQYLEANASEYESTKMNFGYVYERTIKNSSNWMRRNSFDEYRFTIDIREGKDEEYTVKLTNVVGSVKMCIEARYKDFDSEESCINYENLLSNEIYSFTSTYFEATGVDEIHIKVVAADTNSTTGEAGSSDEVNLKYKIEVTKVGDINDIYYGESKYGVVRAEKPQFFRYQFMFDTYTNFTAVTFQAYQLDTNVVPKIKVEATIDPKNSHLREPVSIKTLATGVGTIVFSFNDLRKYCHMTNYSDFIVDEMGEAEAEEDLPDRRRMLQFIGGDHDYWRRGGDRVNKTNPDYDNSTKIEEPEYYTELCTLHVKVSTYNTDQAKFRISAIQNTPYFGLTNGSLNFYPAPSHETLQFYYDLTKADKDLSIAFYTDYNQLHVRTDVYDYGNYGSSPYQTKALIVSGRAQMTLDISDMTKNNESYPYMIITVEDPERQREKWYEPFNTYSKLGIKISSEIEYLLPHELRHKKGFKGTFTYFMVEADLNDSLLISCNVDGEGDADLYINPGKYNYTAMDNYYKKSTGLSDDEITLTVEDHRVSFAPQSDDDSEDEVEEGKQVALPKTGYYTIGVYVYRDCEYDVIALKGMRVIKTYSGDKFTQRTTLDNPLIFEIENSFYQTNVDFIYWSDETLVSVFISKYSMKNDTYDEKTGKYTNELFQKLPSFLSYELTDSSKVVGKARRFSIPSKSVCEDCNYLVSIYPKDLNTNSSLIHFVRFANYSTVSLKSGEVMKHILKPTEKQNFRYFCGDNARTVYTEFVIRKGSIVVSYQYFTKTDASAKSFTVKMEHNDFNEPEFLTIPTSSLKKDDDKLEYFYFEVKATEDAEFDVTVSSYQGPNFVRITPGTMRRYSAKQMQKPIKKSFFYFKYNNNSGIENATITLGQSKIDIDLLRQKISVFRYENLNSENPTELDMNRDYIVDMVGDKRTIFLEMSVNGYYVFKFDFGRDNLLMRLGFNDITSLFANSKEVIAMRPGGVKVYQIGVPTTGLWSYSMLSCEKGFKLFVNLKEPLFNDNNLVGSLEKKASQIEGSTFINPSDSDSIYVKIQYEASPLESNDGTFLFNSNLKTYGGRYSDAQVDISQLVSEGGIYYDGFNNQTNNLFFRLEIPSVSSSILRKYPQMTHAVVTFKYSFEITTEKPDYYSYFYSFGDNRKNRTEFCNHNSLLEFNTETIKIKYVLTPNRKRFVPVTIFRENAAKENIRNITRRPKYGEYKSYFVEKRTMDKYSFNISSNYKLRLVKKIVIMRKYLEEAEYHLSSFRSYFVPSSYYRLSDETNNGFFDNKTNPNKPIGVASSFWTVVGKGLGYGLVFGCLICLIAWCVRRCKDEVTGRRALRGEMTAVDGEYEIRGDDFGNEDKVTGIEMV